RRERPEDPRRRAYRHRDLRARRRRGSLRTRRQRRAVHDAALETAVGRLHGVVRRSRWQHLLSRQRGGKPMSILNDPKLEALLAALHAQSEGQSGAMAEYFGRRAREGTLDWKHMDEETHSFFRDKMVALEKDKAEYCYALCRALRATRVVEAGTSFGVSTLYL